MIRITADIDTLNMNVISLSLHKALNHIKEIQSIILKKSNSKGYHIIVWTKHKYTTREIYKLREIIGDDIIRIKNDKLRKIGLQTLFDKKIRIK